MESGWTGRRPRIEGGANRLMCTVELSGQASNRHTFRPSGCRGGGRLRAAGKAELAGVRSSERIEDIRLLKDVRLLPCVVEATARGDGPSHGLLAGQAGANDLVGRLSLRYGRRILSPQLPKRQTASRFTFATTRLMRCRDSCDCIRRHPSHNRSR